MSTIEIDFGECQRFVNRLSTASSAFRKELEVFLEAIGEEALRIIEDEIIDREVVDSRLLLNSFHKGDENNVWELNKGSLTLTFGTNVEYAEYVNNGHWTNTKGKIGRWIPGHWDGKRFIYEPGAKTGMYLRQQWVEGKPFWDMGLKILEEMLPTLLEKKVDKWLQTYFAEYI